MKKLLTILAAAGLTATTSATVVACANSAVDTKAAVKGTVGTETSIQLQNWDDIVKNANGKTITLSVEKGLQFVTNDYLKLTKSDDLTKATLTVSDKDTTKGKITFKVVSAGTFKVTIDKNKDANLKATTVAVTAAKKDIKNLISSVNVGADEATVEEAVKTAVGFNVVKDTDYTISGDTNEAGKITVSAATGSKLISGTFTITVNTLSISDVTIDPVVVGSSMDTLKDSIQTAIDNVHSGLKLDTDYTISGDTNEAGKITVSAATGSKLISGTFTITVNTLSISDVTIDPVVVGSSMDTLKDSIQTAIDNVHSGLKLDTDYTISGDTNEAGKITVSAATGSKLISGTFTITVNKLSLQNLSVDLGITQLTVKEVIDKITTVMTDFASAAVLDTDYTISIKNGDNDVITGDTILVPNEAIITIDSKGDSSLIQDTLELHVVLSSK